MPYRELNAAYRWVIGFLLAMVISVGGWGLMKVTELDAQVAGNNENIGELQRAVTQLNNRFDRVEQKLDAIRYPSRDYPPTLPRSSGRRSAGEAPYFESR